MADLSWTDQPADLKNHNILCSGRFIRYHDDFTGTWEIRKLCEDKASLTIGDIFRSETKIYDSTDEALKELFVQMHSKPSKE
jgi:hypothetical protein